MLGFAVFAREPVFFIEQLLEHFAGNRDVLKGTRVAYVEIGFAGGAGLEESADLRGGVAKERVQGLIDQREAQLAFDGFAELIGDGQFHLGLGAGGVRVGFWLEGHVELAFHAEAALGNAEFAIVQRVDAGGEVREMDMIDLEIDLIETGLQVEHAMLDDRVSFERQQREAAFEA